MEPLTELCDLIAENPTKFSDKLAWICSRCPSPESLHARSPRVSRSQLNAVLAVARFLSRCPNSPDHQPQSVVLEFLRSISSSFRKSFWPQSFSAESISSFYSNFLGYVAKATELSPELAEEVAEFMGEDLISALHNNNGDDTSRISKVFLLALSDSFLPVTPSDGEKLVSILLDQVSAVSPLSSVDASQSVASSFQSSPSSLGYFHPSNENGMSPAKEGSQLSGSSSETVGNSRLVADDATSSMSSRASEMNGGSSVAMGSSFGLGDGIVAAARQQVANFEEESIDGLEVQAIAFKLIGHILEKVRIDPKLLEQVNLITRRQLQLLTAFLKIRKRDWTVQGQHLKSRVNAKLSTFKAAAGLKVKSLGSVDTEGKSSKKLLLDTLSLFVEAAEACLLSVWRKFRLCEELFSCLLSGVSFIASARGGQQLRILLIRLKPLVLTACIQADTWGSSQGPMFESILKTSCEIISHGWEKDRTPVDTFIMGLTTCIRERNDYDEEERKEKSVVPSMQLNVIRLLADLNVSLKKPEMVDMILPLFIESLEEGNASTPSVLRLRLLDAVSRMASLGFEKSYRETVVLMTRSYISKLSSIGSAENSTLPPEATTERVEALPAGFVLIARDLTEKKLRSDYRHRLLSLCSDVGLAAESKSGRSGADFLGPLLPAVAEICSDFDPTANVEPSLLKLFRNLWFYIALYGLAPPIQKSQISTSPKPDSSALSGVGSMSTISLQSVGGPYMWDAQWPSAIQRIAQATPPLVVSSVKWLEDEFELNALHNPGSRRGSGNEKAAATQRHALSAALGGRVEAGAMNTISGVKATYLLAVAFLEVIRFSSNGGILNGGPELNASRSAFSCAFEYLKTPNLVPAVLQCLTAIVHQAFETAVSWLEERVSGMGDEAVMRESTLSIHACFLIKSMSLREEHIRDISVNLLVRLRDKFSQVLWYSSCVDSLLFSANDELDSSHVNDPACVAAVRALYQKTVREWVIVSLSYAPCTAQGLLQEKLCKPDSLERAQPTTDVVSLLTEIRIGTGKNDNWTGTKTANIPAVMAAAAAASGANLNLTEAFNLEVLSTGVTSAAIKAKHVGEIAGMRRLYNSIGGLQSGTGGFGLSLQRLRSGAYSQSPQNENDSFNGLLLGKFVNLIQQFVNTSEKGGTLDKASFRETCSQATALLLSNLSSDSKTNAEPFSQLLRLLCWCPAYICTIDAMETGIFVWTWLVSAAPQLGCLVLAELVDAWLWTIDTKRGLFASDVKFSGPTARLRPHLVPGEPEAPPEKDPVEQIMAHRLWLGFFLDRFEVVRYNSSEQLLLFGRLLQGTTRLPSRFSRHPVATGTFFTLMLLGLKICSCKSQNNLVHFKQGLRLLEDRIYRTSLGWFAFEPEWFDVNSKNFAQSEAQSVSAFVNYLMNEKVDFDPQSDSKAQGNENGSVSAEADQHHPVWGRMENYLTARDKRKQLLLMLCQHEADRLEVWAQPTNSKDGTIRPKISSDKWIEYARTSFAVDPCIALSLVSRFQANTILKAEITQLVQSHISELRCFPEALSYFVTPKAVDENSTLLQQLPHWAACSVTKALEFLTPAYKGHPRVMAYILRVLESYPPEHVTFFMPQLVQALRYDEQRLVEGYLIRAAQRSDIFAHILIWHLQGETVDPDAATDPNAPKLQQNTSFQELLPKVRQRIIDSFTPKALGVFNREFDFFDKVTSISGVLFPVPKEERRAGIRRELEKIKVEGDDLYLPTAPSKLVKGIQIDSGIPLQSAAKVPIMITFNVADKGKDQSIIMPQACIFKVGDDCRQDLLALQVISLLKNIFDAVGLKLYLYPYGVLPTGPERGIIEVVPNARSRSQMGETTDGGLYEIFQQDFGPVGSSSFESARENFLVSSAGYAVASLLLQPKDRHNGNLLFDNSGRLVHIDFGFILETSPGGNMRFESAHFKLSHEMTQLLDPSGVMKSDTWHNFVGLCVKGYLAARRYMDGIINTVLMMMDSGLPCFSRGDPIGNLRKRFHPEMSEREAANFMIHVCTDAYNKWTTAGYDLIQYLQQGIEK